MRREGGVRFILLEASAALFFLLVAGTLYHLQIQKGAQYRERAAHQEIFGTDIVPERGGIFMHDKEGRAIPLAVNRDYPFIFASPKDMANQGDAKKQDPIEIAGLVSELLDLPVEDLLTRFLKSTDVYEPLIERASSTLAKQVEEAHIPGLYVMNQRARYYPLGDFASQVVGFARRADEKTSEVGQYGIEAHFNDELAGVSGKMLDDHSISMPVPGRDIYLTLDQLIQRRAEELLSDLVKSKNALGGSIIVMESHSGRILAMTSLPTFDPNNYGASSFASFTNPVVQGLYEPGSVFKPLTMAIGLDLGVITPTTTFNDPGYFTADGKTIKNWDLKAHGGVTMTEVIEQSINTGTVFAQRKIGRQNFYNYLLKFGFKEPTNITLPGEVSGRLTPLEKHPREINFATAAYGQGVAVTPIRLLSALNALANGGLLVEPYIIEGAKVPAPRRVIRETAAREAAAMMVSAVRKAQIADLAGYTVAGKTGTAFKPDFEKGGYTDKVINSYIGFAPAFKPRFTALIKLDEPENAPLAGTTVVPAFRDLAEFILNYYSVPPDKSQ